MAKNGQNVTVINESGTYLARSPNKIVVWSTAFVKVIICGIFWPIIYGMFTVNYSASVKQQSRIKCCTMDNSMVLSCLFGNSAQWPMVVRVQSVIFTHNKTRTD